MEQSGTVNQTRLPSERQQWVEKNPLCQDAKTELIEYYNSGHGFKTIAKELNLSYTETRNLLIGWLKVSTRKGTSVVTDALRKKRSENVKGEKSPFYNWIEKYPERAATKTKSLQGWHRRKSGEYVWLRSCLEFIYAKWLDEHNIQWKSEVKTLKGNQETYRPDFFIYENNQLVKVVEVKGNYFDNVDKRSEKAKRICELNGVVLDLIRDIKPYLKDGSYYHKELKEWKTTRQQFGEKSN